MLFHERASLDLFARLKKEYQIISQSPPAGVSVTLASDSDLYVWEALLDGPVDSVYKG